MKNSMGRFFQTLRFAAVFMVLALLLSGCGETAMTGFNDFYGRDNITIDGNYIYYKDVVTVEEAYPSLQLKELKINIPEGIALTVAAVGSDGTIYLNASDTSDYPNALDRSLSSIGYYDAKKEQYVPLIQSDGSHLATFSAFVANRYIVWSKIYHEGWDNEGLFLYDVVTGENTQIYSPKVAPNTDSCLMQPNHNNIVTIGNDIYFSVTGYQNNVLVSSNIYRYSIGNKALESVSQETGTLFSYQGGVVYLTEAKKDEESGTYSRQIKTLSGEVLEEIDNSEYGSTVGGGDILVRSGYFSLSQSIDLKKKYRIETAWEERILKGTKDEQTPSGGSYVEILSGGSVHPLVATQLLTNINEPKTDGRFVYWDGSAPAFYDAEIDKIVLLGFSGMGTDCDIIMGENRIVLSVVLPYIDTQYFYIMYKPF